MSEISIKIYNLKKTFKALENLASAKEALKIQEEKLRETLKKIQSECPHEFEYIPDASGNNDDGHCCAICGVWR